jgi:hypothetical protein
MYVHLYEITKKNMTMQEPSRICIPFNYINNILSPLEITVNKVMNQVAVNLKSLKLI